MRGRKVSKGGYQRGPKFIMPKWSEAKTHIAFLIQKPETVGKYLEFRMLGEKVKRYHVKITGDAEEVLEKARDIFIQYLDEADRKRIEMFVGVQPREQPANKGVVVKEAHFLALDFDNPELDYESLKSALSDLGLPFLFSFETPLSTSYLKYSIDSLISLLPLPSSFILIHTFNS
jgi:hypothetical protein